VLKCLAISTASWKPIAVIAKDFGLSTETKNNETKAKTVAIKYA
jgi:hypothetical protein